MSAVSDLATRVEQLERLVLGMKKEIGTLRNGTQSAVEPGECVKGQDGDDCPFASTYRYQKGCRAPSCKRANSEYYNKGGVRDQAKNGVTETPVASPKKTPAAKKAAPVKKAAPKPIVKKGLLKRA